MPNLNFHSFVSVLAFAAMSFTPAIAQEEDLQENGTTVLDRIVYVGTGLPTEVLNNPASVSVLDKEQIERVPPSSVARILDQVPGVQVTQSGIERIKIRGENSQRVSIQIDGQQLTDHTGYGTPILISPDSIERIEIVRGPSSVISGNNAIGGVINIITKRGADKPLEVTTTIGYMSATKGFRASTTAAGTLNNLDYRLTYSKSELGDLRTTNGTLDNSSVSDRELSAYLGYALSENHYLGFRALDFDLTAEVGTGNPLFIIDLPKRDLRKYSAFYEGTDLASWLPKFRLEGYTQEIDRDFLNDVTIGGLPFPPFPPGSTMNVVSTSDDLQETWGTKAEAELFLGGDSRTIVGASYENDSQIADKLTTTTMPFGPPSVTTRYSDATISTWSGYAQHEMPLSDQLTASFGGRYYQVQSDRDIYRINGVLQPVTTNTDDRFVGAAGLVYKPNEDTTFRAHVGQGYSYPSVSQLYLETTAGGQGIIIGNPNLQPETSTTYEVGARTDHDGIVLDATLFYTPSENYIATLPTGNIVSGQPEYQYQNIDSVISWGGELSAEFDSGVWGLRPYVNAAYLHREFTYANGYSTTDTGTPRLTATLGVRRDWNWGGLDGEWDVFVKGATEAAIRDESGVVEDSTSAYRTVNFRLAMKMSENVSLDFTANNILNASYRPLSEYEGAARNYSVFLRSRF